jgi:L-iditol 2-dehydrogenase
MTLRYANTYLAALNLIGTGAVNVDAVITHHFGIEDAAQALTLGRREPRSLKAILQPDRLEK